MEPTGPRAARPITAQRNPGSMPRGMSAPLRATDYGEPESRVASPPATRTMSATETQSRRAQQTRAGSVISRRAAPGPAIVSVIAIRAAVVSAVVAVGVGRVGVAVIARIVVVRARIVGTRERGTD